MNKPMATRLHHQERAEQADDAAERVVRISVEWIVVAFFLAMLLGMHIGIDMAERERARAQIESSDLCDPARHGLARHGGESQC